MFMNRVVFFFSNVIINLMSKDNLFRFAALLLFMPILMATTIPLEGCGTKQISLKWGGVEIEIDFESDASGDSPFDGRCDLPEPIAGYVITYYDRIDVAGPPPTTTWIVMDVHNTSHTSNDINHVDVDAPQGTDKVYAEYYKVDAFGRKHTLGTSIQIND